MNSEDSRVDAENGGRCPDSRAWRSLAVRRLGQGMFPGFVKRTQRYDQHMKKRRITWMERRVIVTPRLKSWLLMRR